MTIFFNVESLMRLRLLGLSQKAQVPEVIRAKVCANLAHNMFIVYTAISQGKQNSEIAKAARSTLESAQKNIPSLSGEISAFLQDPATFVHVMLHAPKEPKTKPKAKPLAKPQPRSLRRSRL